MNEKKGYWERHGLPEELRRRAERHPNKPLVTDSKGILTYGRAVELAQRAARGLERLGITSGQCVLVQTPNWTEGLVIHLALEAIGAVAVPLPPIYRAKEVGYIAKLTDAVAAVITSRFSNFDFSALYRELAPTLPSLQHMILVGDPAGAEGILYESLIADDGQLTAISTPFDSDPNAVMEIGFTSGSTGEPKGAVHTSNTLSFEHRTWAYAYGLREDDVFFAPTTIGHQLGYSVMRAAILVGASLLFVDKWEAESCTELMARENVSFVLSTPAFLFGVLDSAALAQIGGLPKMRIWALAGQVVTSELHNDAVRKLPGVRFGRQFGMTEIGSMIVNPMNGPAEKAMATGRLQPGARLNVVDADLHEVPDGGRGELLLKAPSLFLGYYGRPDLDDCFTSEGYFRTGDEVIYDDDGWVWVTGRIKDLIKRGGESVSPAELEEVLASHPNLYESTVVGIPDPRLGERVCVFAVLRPGKTVTLEEITQYLAGTGMAKQKLPERLMFVDALPRGAVGKVDKAKLRELAVRTPATNMAPALMNSIAVRNS
jgi:non-ribosomal peptide synthetase component E (peptide arylation enzyme)